MSFFFSQAVEAKERMEMDDEERQGTLIVCCTFKKGELLFSGQNIFEIINATSYTK